jgi:hypothetical protein
MINEKIGQTVAITWSASATSSPFQILPGMAASLSLPAGFTAASVTFEAQEPDGTWIGVNSAGSALSVNVTAGKRNILPEALFSAAAGMMRAVLNASNTGTGYIHSVR